MSLAYCFDCLKRIDECECNRPSDKIIYGELRVAYMEGYRDAKEGKEPNI